MTSVLAALYTDRKMIVYERDTNCVKAAWGRIEKVAMKVTNSAAAPLGKVAEPLFNKKVKKALGKVNVCPLMTKRTNGPIPIYSPSIRS